MRSSIYIGLFAAWGISLRRRIIQTQALRYLTAISALTVFWVAARSVKFYIASDPGLSRCLWYLYYLPMLFIPLLSLLVAMSLGKPDGYRLPRRTALLCIPTALLFLLVLTNDLHQLVFVFPAGAVWSSSDYGYAPAYWAVTSWEILCALSAIVVMLVKCRLPRSRRVLWLPFVPAAAAVAYGLLYVSGARWLRLVAGDMTVVFCLFFIATMESCIQCGLIQSNTGYDALFEASTIKAQIVDAGQSVLCSSASALNRAALLPPEGGTLRLDRGTLIKSHPIRGGYVVWQEDVTELADIMEELEDNRAQLAERNYIERENYETRRRINSLREKNRLYDLLQKHTARQNAALDALLDEYDSAADEVRRNFLLCRIAVIGAYVKRCGNLLFIQQQSSSIPLSELSFALEESFSNPKLTGAECGLSVTPEGDIPAASAIRLYSFFEDAVEAALDGLRSIFVSVRRREGATVLRLELESGAELSALSSAADTCRFEDGIWSLALTVGQGAARNG